MGVRAVIAQSFERIHRSNLVGMGIVPFVFEAGSSWSTAGLKGDGLVSIGGLASAKPRLEYYPVALLNGLPPNGGYVADARIWAAKASPFMLPMAQRQAATRHEDIDQGGTLAFSVENVPDAADSDRFCSRNA